MSDKLETIRQACITANPAIRNAVPIRRGGKVDDYQDRPIRLADVLLTVASSVRPPEEPTAFQLSERFREYDDKLWSVINCWNWRADDLTQQSPETINFLYELLKEN